MTTSAILEQMRREVEVLQSAVLAQRYGVASEQLVLVLGDQTPQEAIDAKLGHVPADIRVKVKVQLIRLDWLKRRQVAPGGDTLIQTQERAGEPK